MDGEMRARGATTRVDTGSQATEFAIFGSGGDLAWRMLYPALYDLFADGKLVDPFRVLGLDRQDVTLQDFVSRVRDGVSRFARHTPLSGEQWERFAPHLDYMKADFKDTAAFPGIAQRLGRLGDEGRPVSRVFYCATPPSLFGPIADGLAGAGLGRQDPGSRIVLEKPFGYDLSSAKELNARILAAFDESQIYRIDHFLGKETVQNILAFRFANPIFEPVWNCHYVDHVTISVAEDIGIGNRGDYYDKAGCLRDMVQNHLLQLLCVLAMEPPVAFNADEVRDRKVDVLHAVRPIGERDVSSMAVRGQYERGWLHGEEVPGYREEPGVGRLSETETFCALKLHVDDWRWQGVPFYLRTGKRMPETYSEMVVAFKDVPHQAFPPEAVSTWNETLLAIGMRPYEGALLRVQAKRPGLALHLDPVDLYFTYRKAFETPIEKPYETLLFDVITGDPTLFMRADQVEAAWSIVDPVLSAWSSEKPDASTFHYQAGTWGPLPAEDLVARDRHVWPMPALVSVLAPQECAEERTASSEGKAEARESAVAKPAGARK